MEVVTPNPIILSYHKFVAEPEDYKFSRTFEQFYHDIRKKEFSLITIDDGRKCTIQACQMMQEIGIRAKLFICTSLVGSNESYCTWDDIEHLSMHHDIENHSHIHCDLRELNYEDIRKNILMAQSWISHYIRKAPEYFVAPYNYYNEDVERAVKSIGLKIMKDRINMTNYYK